MPSGVSGAELTGQCDSLWDFIFNLEIFMGQNRLGFLRGALAVEFRGLLEQVACRALKGAGDAPVPAMPPRGDSGGGVGRMSFGEIWWLHVIGNNPQVENVSSGDVCRGWSWLEDGFS